MNTGEIFEIVQLPNGDYVLQASGENSEHLLKISFGAEAKAYLGQHDVTVAKAMIGAAVRAVETLREGRESEQTEASRPTTIH